MSVSLTEFVSAWNDAFTFQIRESEIKNPTEPFFRRCLILLLKSFYVDTTRYDNMDNEMGNDLRLTRIKLVAVVNHFYKIAYPGAKQNFGYMDMIQPTFKKVFNVLNYLLNYYVFVRQTYAHTIQSVKEKVNLRDELQRKKHQLLKSIEEEKIKEENTAKVINSLERKIPRQKEKITELASKEQDLHIQTAKSQKELEDVEMKLIEDGRSLEEAQSSLISDSEAQEIIKTKEKITKQLEEENFITQAVRQKLHEHSNTIQEIRLIIAEMEQIQLTFDVDASEIIKKKKEVENLKVEISGLSSNVSKDHQEIDFLSNSLQMKISSIELLQQKIEETKKIYAIKEMEKKKKIDKLSKSSSLLTRKEAKIFATNQRLYDEQTLLKKITEHVIKKMSIDKQKRED